MDWTECPHCGSFWGFEEISFQECDCCCYPDNEDEEEYFDDTETE